MIEMMQRDSDDGAAAQAQLARDMPDSHLPARMCAWARARARQLSNTATTTTMTTTTPPPPTTTATTATTTTINWWWWW